MHNKEEAYKLTSPRSHRGYYDKWASKYDKEFVEAEKYIYPEIVANIFRKLCKNNYATIADIGCGTGAVGEQFFKEKFLLDGFDISSRMLAEAKRKNVYRALIECDVTKPKQLPFESYDGVISCGTFTLGHLGPDVIKNMLKLCADQALCLIGVNLEHYENLGFKSTFTELQSQKRIENFEIITIPIYEDTTILNTEKNLANLCIFNFCESA